MIKMKEYVLKLLELQHFTSDVIATVITFK